MISKVHIPSDNLLHQYFGGELSFTDGINVVYGPNGSGKTFLLDTLSHNVFIKGKGWSEIITFSDTGFYSSLYNFDMKDYLSKKDYGKCDIEWDGVACFRTDGVSNKSYINRKVGEIMCGCKNDQEISYEDMKRICRDKLSNGQVANVYLDTLMNLVVPDLTVGRSKDRWNIDYENLLGNYVFPMKRDGKPTLLIDELDSYFDFDNLYNFWINLLPELVKKYQIIIVTHNPLFINDGMNVIGEEFYKKSLLSIKNLIK